MFNFVERLFINILEKIMCYTMDKCLICNIKYTFCFN